MKDLVIGQATHFDWPTLEPSARSLWMSGFDGKKVLFVKAISQEARENLLALGFELFEIVGPPQTKDFFQGAGRLLKTWEYINNHKDELRYVIFTDTRDLVFQSNPSDWLHERLREFGPYDYLSAKLVAAPEHVPHTNEAWNASYIKSCFSEVEEWIGNKDVICSGVIAGYAEYVAELCLTNYMVTRCLAAKAHGIDQPGLNVLLHQRTYQDITLLPKMQDAWCINCQVMASPSLIETYRPWLTDDEPEFRNGLVYPKYGDVPFRIVHQYDRNPEWTQIIRKRYCKDPRL